MRGCGGAGPLEKGWPGAETGRGVPDEAWSSQESGLEAGLLPARLHPPRRKWAMALFRWGHHGGFHEQPLVCTSQGRWARRGAGQGSHGTAGAG